jgi:hypothetical protein
VNPWPISPLAQSDLDFAIVNYDFTGLTADKLGPTDGLLAAMDTTIPDFGQSIADQILLIASMDSDLDDLPIILTEMNIDDSAQVLSDLAGIAAAGDSLLNNFTGLAG